MSEADFSDVFKTAKLFENYDRPWAVCGGWAIDLYLGRITRAHKDIDIAVFRSDQLVIQNYLSSRGWTLEKATGGNLYPWQMGEWIDLPVHTIWCRNPKSSPDFIELLFNEVDKANFYFRRDTSITFPRENIILRSDPGIPILAPEIVLLYKSSNADNPSHMEDFRNLLPKLSPKSCTWFATALRRQYRNHVWLAELSKI